MGAASVAILAVLCVLPQAWGNRPNPEMLLHYYEPAMALPLVRCLPEMILGLLAFRLSAAPFGRWLARNTAAGLMLSGVIIVLLTVPEADLGVVILFPLLILALASDDHLPGRVLACQPIEFLGRLSYSIYLTHELMSGLMGQVHATIKALGWPWLRRVFHGGVGRAITAEPSAP